MNHLNLLKIINYNDLKKKLTTARKYKTEITWSGDFLSYVVRIFSSCMLEADKK